MSKGLEALEIIVKNKGLNGIKECVEIIETELKRLKKHDKYYEVLKILGWPNGKPNGGLGVFCPNCGNQVGPTMAFCPNCGKPVGNGKKHCPKCGAENENTSSFCCKCGTKL